MTATAGTASPPRPPARVTANLFGVGFGLVGLAGSWRAAAHMTSAPGWVADALAVAAAAAWVAVGAAWVAQLAGGRRSIAGELHDPVLSPFVSLLPIVAMLLALELAGGLIAAQGAGQMGWPRPARALFGIGVGFWLLLGPVILARPIIRPPLPAALSPTLAIEGAPPALAGSAYLALTGGRFDALTCALAGVTALMVLVQLRLIPLYRRAPFGPGSWSFTFAYAAVATFALQLIGREHPPGAAAWAWTVLSLITIIIGAIAARTLIALGRGQFLSHPAATTAATRT
jgi:tellurite resistance protein